MSFRPLEGVRVLDLTRLLPGPYLSQLLADLGADVVKLEEPGLGDYARWIPPGPEGAGHAFAAFNRGKRSVAVDLKKPGAARVVLRLAHRSDVFLESFRPGVLDRLGLSDALLAETNPRLVRLGLVGHGPGPLRNAPGHDLTYEALAGILAIQGTAAGPLAPAVPLADLAGALYGAAAVMGALLERARTGQGRRLEVALSDAALAFNALNLARSEAGDAPARGRWPLSGGMVCYRTYRCKDGRFVAFAALEPKFWDLFVDAVDQPDLAPHHLDGSVQAHARLELLFSSRPAAEWVEKLGRAGVPISLVLEPGEALDAQPRAARRPGPGFPLTHRPSPGAVPALGEHTDEVLEEAGFTAEERDHLRADGVLP